MLRFFRNIRQTLLENGNIRKYFWYAVGEILLVMIGILLALQVNNWNQQRIERSSEQRYLNNLRSDIELQINELDLTVQSEKQVALTLQNAGHFIEKESYLTDMDSLNTLLSVVIAYRAVNIFDATFEDLKSTGNIRLISNERLKQQVLECYQALNRLDRVLSKNEVIKGNIRESLASSSLLNFQVDYEDALTDYLETSGLKAENLITDDKIVNDLNAFISDRIRTQEGLLTLNNLMTNRYFSSMVTLAAIGRTRGIAVQLLDEIDRELGLQ